MLLQYQTLKEVAGNEAVRQRVRELKCPTKGFHAKISSIYPTHYQSLE